MPGHYLKRSIKNTMLRSIKTMCIYKKIFMLLKRSSSRNLFTVFIIIKAAPAIIAGEKKKASKPPPVAVFLRINTKIIIKYAVPASKENVRPAYFLSKSFPIPYINKILSK